MLLDQSQRLTAPPPGGPAPEQLRTLTGTHLRRIACAGIGAIDKRLEELERECPGERVLRWTAAAVTVVGFALAAAVSPWWLALPAVAGPLLVQLSCRSCCALSPLVGRLGLRSAVEIERERAALEALRGDFHALPAACA